MIKWKLISALLLSVALSGCVTSYKKGVKVSEFKHNGRNYDVYDTVVVEKDSSDRVHETPVRVIVNKGANPSDLGLNTIKGTCYNDLGRKTTLDCYREFARQLNIQKQTALRDSESEESSGSMY